MIEYEKELLKAIKEVKESIEYYSDFIFEYLDEINKYKSQGLVESILHEKQKFNENQLLANLIRIQTNIAKCEEDFKLKTQNLNKIILEAPKNIQISTSTQIEFNNQLIKIMRNYLRIFEDVDDIKDTEYDVLSDNDFGIYDLNIFRTNLDIAISKFNRTFNTQLLNTLQAAKESRKLSVDDILNTNTSFKTSQ